MRSSAAEPLDALGEPAQAVVAGAAGQPSAGRPLPSSRRSSASAVAVGAAADSARAVRLAVAQRVGDAFLRGAVQRERGVGRQRAPAGASTASSTCRPAWLRARALGQVVERLGQAEAVEHQRRQARDQAVHGVVEPRRLVGDQPRRLLATAASTAPTRCAIDSAMLRIAVTDWPSSSCSSRAIRRRSCSMWWSIQRVSSRLSDSSRSARAARRSVSRLRAQHADHAVEGRADGRRLAAAQRRQRDVEAAGLAARSSAVDDARERPHRAADEPEHQHVDDAPAAPADDGEQVSRTQSQASSTAREALARTSSRPSASRSIVCTDGAARPGLEPARRVAAGLVRRRRRAVELAPAASSSVMSFERTRPMPRRNGEHRRHALRPRAARRAVEQLRGDAVGGDHLLVHRLAHVAQLQPEQRGRRRPASARRRSG